MMHQNMEDFLKEHIRTIPDFPKAGILFRDITPLLGNAPALKATVDGLTQPYANNSIDYVVGIESRGFLFGIPLAFELGVGFIPIRKKGKLPATTIAEEYTLEYDTSTIEVHEDALQSGKRVVIIDDLLATGGTARASVNLMRRLGAEVIGISFVIELSALNGRAKLTDVPIHTLVRY